MSLYPKQSLQMLVDLINQANPQLPVPLTTTNALYGTPAVIAPGGNIQNTSIKVTALAGTKYVGNTTLTYRRLDFSILFRNLPIVIYKYSPAANNASPYKISDLLPVINAKYGLSLTTTDIVDGSLPAGNTNANATIGLAAGTRNSSIVVNAQTGSPGFVGSFTLYWVQAPQDISQMISVTSLETSRAFPGSKSTIDGSLYVVSADTYAYDFTSVIQSAAFQQGFGLGTALNWYNGSQYSFGTTNATVILSQQALLAAINQATGQSYNFTNPASTQQSLYGVFGKYYSLPNAAVPEANSKYFNSCIVIDIPAANSWGAGRMILHFNQ